jgi:hypothetical protein
MSTSAHRDPRGSIPRGNSEGNNPGRRFRANQPGTHTLAARGLDSYPPSRSRPRIAVESLLDAEPGVLNTMARVWEPAAGEGNIVHVLRDNGIPCIASGIERRLGGGPGSARSCHDAGAVTRLQ